MDSFLFLNLFYRVQKIFGDETYAGEAQRLVGRRPPRSHDRGGLA
jgi:hypothetical protein